MEDYESYLAAEWKLFLQDPARARATLEAVGHRRVVRALDVGCGRGQELIPLVRHGAIGVGVDLAPQVGRAPWPPNYGHVIFARCAAERLPFGNDCFEVVVCRLALPYMHNREALGEMARVLRSGGLLLLKIHAAPYYLRKLRLGLLNRDSRSYQYAIRVLIAGTLYHLLGVQVRSMAGGETFQSKWMLKRELRRCGMRIVINMPDSNPRTPSFGIEKL